MHAEAVGERVWDEEAMESRAGEAAAVLYGGSMDWNSMMGWGQAQKEAGYPEEQVHTALDVVAVCVGVNVGVSVGVIAVFASSQLHLASKVQNKPEVHSMVRAPHVVEFCDEVGPGPEGGWLPRRTGTLCRCWCQYWCLCWY